MALLPVSVSVAVVSRMSSMRLVESTFDLVRWLEYPEELIANFLQPAVIERVVLNPAEHRAVVVVQPDQVALVLGRRGHNRQLASELTGWQIDIEELKE